MADCLHQKINYHNPHDALSEEGEGVCLGCGLEVVREYIEGYQVTVKESLEPPIRPKYVDPEKGVRCKGPGTIWHLSKLGISRCEHCQCGARFVYPSQNPLFEDAVCHKDPGHDGPHWDAEKRVWWWSPIAAGEMGP